MKKAAVLTTIIFSFAVLTAPLNGFAAANLTNNTETQEELTTEAYDPNVILPRAVHFHVDSITAEIGTYTDATGLLTIFPETSTERKLTFESSNPMVATVDENGIITARRKGESIITVTTVNGKTAELEYTVFGTDVEWVSISRPASDSYTGDVIALSATVYPSNASIKKIFWSSSDDSIATVDDNGNVTCILPGNATITATAFGGESASITVNVKEIVSTAVTIRTENYEGKKGEKIPIITTVYPLNATFKDVTYESSNPGVAKVSEDGIITLRAKGSCIITATTRSGAQASYKMLCTKTFESAHFYQGDPKWKFSTEVRKKACLITAFAILLKNIGIDATPRTAYNAGGTGLNLDSLAKAFPFKSVSALKTDSEYFGSYVSGRTYVKDVNNNAVAAIKEALDNNPEGVICYFGRGDEKHAVVAIGYVDDIIYYSDPGRARVRGFDVTLANTWVGVGHKMGYRNLQYIVAIDPA